MKFRIKKRSAVLAAVNLLCIAGAVVITAVGASAAKSQSYNNAAERWQNGDDKTDYAQISCFLPENSAFSSDSLGAVRSGVLSALQTVSIAPEEGKKLCPDAYSARLGSMQVKGDLTGQSEAELTAVGGDFFLIHDFRLLDGSFFSDDDVMQDGAVIDRSLAWELYGSCEISGMKLNINGTQFYISGVIETPQTKEEQKCAGELPRAYISYDAATVLCGGSGDFFNNLPDMGGFAGTSRDFSRITCYEILMPDPVKSYALSSVKKLMESYSDDIEIIQNNGRFSPEKRVKAAKKLSMSGVRKTAVAFPFWENASRIVEFRLSVLYLFRRLLYIIPSVTLIWLIIRGIRVLKQNRNRLKQALIQIKNKFARKSAKRSTNEQKS